MNSYKSNIQQMFQTFRRVLQPETLFIWTTALPVSDTVRGGVILDTITFMSDVLRYDILLANDFTSQVATDCGFDVVDLHYEMRRHIGLRLSDGIHWNSLAHRKISGLLLHHICSAWHVVLPLRITVAFSALHTSHGGAKKKSEDSRETVDGDDARKAAPESRGSIPDHRGRNHVDSCQSTVPCGRNGALLPTPISQPLYGSISSNVVHPKHRSRVLLP